MKKYSLVLGLAIVFLFSSIFVVTDKAEAFGGVDLTNVPDDSYTGAGEGFNDDIELEVTVSDGEIADIEVVSHEETDSYWEDGVQTKDDIMAAQSTDVDTETGATKSSDGIVEAVLNALAGEEVEVTEEPEKEEEPAEEPTEPSEPSEPTEPVGPKPDYEINVSGEEAVTVNAMMVENRSLIHSRAFEQIVPVSVAWDDEAKKVVVTGENIPIVEFEIGGDTLYVGDETVDMPVSVASYENQTYIPVRFVLEELGYSVSWYDGTITVEDERVVEEPEVSLPDDVELPEHLTFEDGTYRGTYSDRDEMHVGLQFVLEDNVITDIEHRHMAYDGIDYLENEAFEGIRKQHEQAVEHLEGRDVREAITDLYEPGDYVDDVDGFSGATIYCSKELSAIMDGLNRGVYRFREVGGEVPEDYSSIPEDAEIEDGTYRGTFSDRDEMQVGLQFVVEDNVITDIEHRHMAYGGVDYLDEDADETTKGIRDQHKQAVEHLEGRDIREAITDLYEPGEFVDDVDGYSGATIRSTKELSAIMDGLNRGVYRFREVGGEVPEDYSSIPENVDFEDGTYRGTFSDRDEMQVGLQFVLEDNVITDIGHRHMAYGGVDYLDEDADETTKGIRDQHKQAVEHLEGRDIREAITDLYEPGDYVDDIDGYSGATIRSTKELSSIMDGLNRGVYRFREVGGEVPAAYSPLYNIRWALLRN